MERKKKLLYNTVAGTAKPIVTLICGFILPRAILQYYGSEVNGLISSIAHFLSFISLLDLGVGAVVQSNLYKPLATKDENKISAIVVSSQQFFRRLAYIFLLYIGFLALFLPNTLNASYDFLFTASLVVIIAVSTFAQYFIGMTNQLLLSADQKAYIPVSIEICTIILNTVFCIVLMKAGASIHAVKLVTATIYVLKPIVQNLYVKHNYSINWHVSFAGEPIKQKWNGLSQHFAAVVCENIDVVLLTFFSTLKNVSIYSVYYMVTSGVSMIIQTAASGIESLFGNMLAKGERDTLVRSFSVAEFVFHIVVTVIFSTAAILIVPFILVYTKGINDANYYAPMFATILVAAYAVRCIRIPYFQLIKAAGHFKQTQNGAFISMLLNIVLSVALIFDFGLVGIAFGTFAAMFYHTCYFVWYLRKNILNRKAHHFLKFVITDALCCVVIFILTRGIPLEQITYLSWFFMALKVGTISMTVTLAINAVFNKRQIAVLMSILRK